MSSDAKALAVFFRGRAISGSELLQSSGPVLRTIFDTIGDGIFVVGIKKKSFRILVHNVSFCHMFGLAPADWVGMSLEHVFSTSVAAALDGQFRHVLQQRHIQTAEITTTDQRQLVLILRLIDDTEAGEERIVISCRDITEQQQTLRRLEASEAELRTIFAAMDDLLMVLNREGRYLRIAPTHNPSLLYEPAERLIGHTLQEIFEAETAQVFSDVIATALADCSSIRLEYPLTLEGREYWFAATITPIDQETVLWSARDISERKRIELALTHAAAGMHDSTQDLFVALMAALSQALDMEFALLGLVKDNQHIQVRAAWVDGAEYPPFAYALAGTPCGGVVGGQPCFFNEAVGQRFPEDAMLHEFGIEAYLGYPLHDSQGKPLGLLVVMSRRPLANASTAIALVKIFAARVAAELERERAEQNLRQQEALLRLVIDNIPQGIFWKDNEGVFLGGNHPLSQWLGLAPDALIGKTNADLGIPDTGIEASVLASGEPYQMSALVAPHNHWCQTSHLPIRDREGQVVGILGMLEDITEHKRFETQLRFLHSLTQAVSNAVDFDAALQVVLAQVCEMAGWDYGEAWLPTLEPRTQQLSLSLSPAVYARLSAFDTFRHLSLTVRFPLGDGLPGRVWQNRKPEYLDNLGQCSEQVFRRARAAQMVGLQAGIAMPIVVGDNVLAVIVFYASAAVIKNNPILEVITAAANQLSVVMQRKQAEAALRQAEEKYRSIFENAVEGIFQTTVAGGYITVNPMLAKLYGYDSPSEMMQALNDISRQVYVDPNRRQAFIDLIQKQGGAVQGFESQVYRKDGSTIWISENARALYDEQGNLTGFEGTVEDITHRKQDREMIEYMAYYDILTELPNRMLFNDRVTMALAQAERNSDELVAVVFLDLDRFKLINDSLGHSVGDTLLENVAHLLRSVLRAGDTISRWGGDEFTLLLPQLHRIEELEGLLERLLTSMASGFDCEGQRLHITCSLGVAIYPWDGHDGPTLLKNADAALYRAKELGRNTYQFYAPAMNAHASARLALENDLRLAITRNELEVYFQPQVHILTGKIVGAETLLRWHHPQQGLMSPTEFIPLAEETGLITTMGEWVLAQSCAYAAQWQKQGFPDFRVAVNLSPKQFQQPDLVARIRAILQETHLSPHALELEITESTAMQDIERTRSILTALRGLGIEIAIDDFGTGYSSIGYLQRFNFNTLKIDQSFVQEVETSRSAGAIAKAIVTLGQGLNLKILAEGVETEGQVRFIQSLGCEYAQGFWYHRPMPAAHFERLLLQSSSEAS